MKIAVFISLVCINFLTFGQTVERGVDSAANRRWLIMPWKTPEGLDCFYKTEYVLNTKPHVLVLACEDSTVLTYSLNFKIKECYDNYEIAIKKPNNQKKAFEQLLRCREDYFKRPENSNKTDTVWMSMNSIEKLDKKTHSDWYETSETYYDSIGSFMFGVFYYTFEEIGSTCILDNPLIKRTESWENGQKHGRWRHYDLTGKLIREEEYKNGVLVN